ncbi:MAG: hypothetical protein H7Y31_01250 [Chitinophagaceae bacterium]|nr:hypothetical protein [Chitinophagaceae bacterium]
MKKLVIGAIVGGILVFLWQTLSWTVLQVHAKEYQKAPNEAAILQTLGENFAGDGQYRIPNLEPTASSADSEKFMADNAGKPWAVVSYHKSYDADMITNVLKAFAADLIAVLFVCYILVTNPNRSFWGIFISTVLIGIAGFLYIPYANHVWWEYPGTLTNLMDVLISWGLCGLWLGWWLRRK